MSIRGTYSDIPCRLALHHRVRSPSASERWVLVGVDVPNNARFEVAFVEPFSLPMADVDATARLGARDIGFVAPMCDKITEGLRGAKLHDRFSLSLTVGEDNRVSGLRVRPRKPDDKCR